MDNKLNIIRKLNSVYGMSAQNERAVDEAHERQQRAGAIDEGGFVYCDTDGMYYSIPAASKEA